MNNKLESISIIGKPPMPDIIKKNHTNVIVSFDNDIDKFIDMRKSKGMSQTSVADVIGYSSQTVISSLECGIKGLSDRAYTLFLLITDFHPTYVMTQKHSQYNELLIPAPEGKGIRKTRLSVDQMKQQEMAWLLGLGSKTLISNYENNRRKPSIQNWTMFLLIINQHPHYSLMCRFNQDIFIEQPDWVVSASVDANGVVRGHGVDIDSLDRNDVMWNPNSDESIVIDCGYDNRAWHISAINRI
jgi:DNA-binding XRE family transcriptional regulator